ncbi:MAG: hypothetical protein H0U19_06095 [Acidobacteria bacterium]|nr:hypothetical protein [Acidobacteriota bacterium]
MKRLFLAPAFGALALATAVPACALSGPGQYGRPDAGRPSYGRSGVYEGERVGYDTGFHEGLHEGQKDGRSRDRFYFQDERDFQRGDKGYKRQFGDVNRYRQSFRQGFADGYAQGYGPYSRGQVNNGRYGDRGPDYGRSGDDRYGNDRWDDRGTYRNAFELGARDGYEKGREDVRDNDRYDPRRHKWYREGDRDYNSRYGSREQYKDEYRRGFTSGYDQGYREERYR